MYDLFLYNDLMIFGISFLLLCRSVIAQPPPPPGGTNKPWIFNYTRPLSEINVEAVGDAYPYISPDGLDVYFTQGNSGNFNLYTASRNNIYDQFSNKTIVSSNFSGVIRGVWLTNDQIELYYSDGSNIYHSKRATISSAFDTPIAVELNDAPSGVIYAPSFTPDQSELMVYNYNNIKSCMLRFTKVSENIYLFADTLSTKKNFVAYPGQFTKDGGGFIGQFQVNDTSKICYMSRQHLNTAFDTTNFSVVKGKFSKYLRNLQPSITADYSTIIYARSSTGNWNDNDLYLTIDSSWVAGINDPKAGSLLNKISVFPNPATDYIIFNSTAQFNNAEIIIYNLLGEEVKKNVSINDNNFKLELGNKERGIYFYTVKNRNNIFTGKIVISD